jgi:hypothetical protein
MGLRFLKDPLDENKAISLFKEGVKLGDVGSFVELAEIYELRGDSCLDENLKHRWYQRSISLYTDAFRQDNVLAMYPLSKIYIDGKGKIQNTKKGMEILNYGIKIGSSMLMNSKAYYMEIGSDVAFFSLLIFRKLNQICSKQFDCIKWQLIMTQMELLYTTWEDYMNMVVNLFNQIN